MATAAPRPSLSRLFFEPLRRGPLVACAILIWVSGAAYCHGYQHLLTGTAGSWSGSLSWSAIAVVPWFALLEWSKQPQAGDAVRRPAQLAAVVLGIAAASICLEYLVDFCLGDVTDRLGLLVLRRLPAVAITVVLIALTRRAMLRQPPAPTVLDLAAISQRIDWVAAADNYVEVHSDGTVALRRMTMRDAEQALGGRGFVRIHRRFLVNRNRIEGIKGNGDKVVRLRDGTELPVGSRYSANLAAHA